MDDLGEFDDHWQGTAFVIGAGAEQRCQPRLARVAPRLRCDGPDDPRLVDRCVYSLWHDVGMEITTIGCDQWLRIRVEHFDFRLWCHVRCERVVDGLAAVWEVCTERLPSAGVIAGD